MKQNWFTIQEVFPNIFGIAEFGHFEEVISYLIIGKKKALLFDTGMGIGNIHQEIMKLTHLPIFVLNSHTHFDHIGNNHLFKTIYIYKNSFALKNAEKGFSSTFMKDHVAKKTFLTQPPKTFKRTHFHIRPFCYSKKIKSGDFISIDPFRFKIIHTPGHSPDSICLYDEKNKLLFSGDTLYPGPIYLQMPESDVEDYKKSIGTLSTLKIKHIFPAHNAFTQNPVVITAIFKKLISKDRMKGNTIVINKDTSLVLRS